MNIKMENVKTDIKKHKNINLNRGREVFRPLSTNMVGKLPFERFCKKIMYNIGKK